MADYYDDVFTPEFCGLPSGFCGIPYAENNLRNAGPRYFSPPPRTRASYSNYDSMGNVVGRLNRASAVQNVEDYYYGGEQVRDYNIPPPKRVRASQDDMIEELREAKKMIFELKQQYRMFVFFIVFVVVFAIAAKSGFIKVGD